MKNLFIAIVLLTSNITSFQVIADAIHIGDVNNDVLPRESVLNGINNVESLTSNTLPEVANETTDAIKVSDVNVDPLPGETALDDGHNVGNNTGAKPPKVFKTIVVEVVQVGDVIRVALPGEDTLDNTYNVQRDGSILLPEVGKVIVAGMVEDAMRQKVHAALSSAFRDLGSLKVFIKEKHLLITVLGYVHKPGEVILPGTASIQMALGKAGGLRSGAQLDKMQLRRNGKVSAFNYKSYLDSGDPNVLPKLEPLDVLFVPASPKIGNVEMQFDAATLNDKGDAAEDQNAVKVFGEVNSPGSFSWRKGATVVDMLMRAGGVTRYAGVEQIRIINDGEPTLFNLKLYLDTGNSDLLPHLDQGATIFAPMKEEEIQAGTNTVYVMGEVFKPGAFEGKEGASFMDVLANAGGPTRYAESRQIRIIHANGQVSPFDMQAYTEGNLKELPKIQSGDAIFVPEKTDMNEKSWLKVAPGRAIRVIGEVYRPGRYEWSDEMSLMDLLAHAGGPKARANTSHIQIVTKNVQGQTKTLEFSLEKYLLSGADENALPKLKAGAIIMVPDLPQDPSDNKAQWLRQSSDKSIYVFGQVGAPGRYMFNDEMNFLDILSAANGPTGNADIHNIRISHRGEGHARVSKLDLGLYFETGDENLLPKVLTGDTVYIPEKNRIWLANKKEETVRVLGAVNRPGRYRFNDDMTLLDLLAEAGGTSATAYVEKISVVNLSCCKDQARSFDLEEFSTDADFSKLPVLRAGDTVYIPDNSNSIESKVRRAIQDTVQALSLLSLLAGL
jgi:protein involved in polysaccharide export with SLBB domain